LTFLLANWRLVLLAVLVAAVGIQTARLNATKSEFALYKADIQKQVAENAAKAAQERARMAQNQSEALGELQTRLDRLNRSYRVLRDRRSTQSMPSLSSAAPSISSCPGDPSQPDSVARRLDEIEAEVIGALETGDLELGKYAELWRLQQLNAGANPVQSGAENVSNGAHGTR
jgi:hypothetical protein